MFGQEVVIRSVAGVSYRGIVRMIVADRGHGELFELGRAGDGRYQRFVYVRDRRRQIHPAETRSEAGPAS